ncbi:MAG: hypothetical protein IJ007_05490 [Oscillospiraceae bacterium]|nr:hypothetical protein [Oscillospiraceae bacterium]
MLAEIKLEAIEWYYMEIDYAIKHNLQMSHEIVFEKTLDTAMRDLTDFEYMVWCFEILSRYERQMIPMCQGHIKEIKKAINIYNSLDCKSTELSEDEIIQLKKDYKMAVDYIEWSSSQE